MTILIIDNSVAFTGAFKCAVNEVQLLRERHEFVFVIPEESNQYTYLQEQGFTVYRLPLREIKKSPTALLAYPFALLRNTAALRKIVRKHDVDVVQVNDFYNLLGAMLKLTGFKGKLLTYVRFLPSAIPAPLRKLWTRVAQRYSHRVIAVSDAVLQQLPPNENTIRIYDPVHLSETLPAVSNTNGDIIQFLYLGNYIQGKGQDYAVQAFAQAYQQNKNIRLRFAGSDMGLEKNARFKQGLQDEVLAKGLQDVVSFDGFATHVERDIKAADVVLNFSDSESFSMTCLEASFYGRPVIATHCGGPEEIINDGKTGLLVNKAAIDEMSAAILRLAADAGLRERMDTAGKTYVSEKFNTQHFITAFENMLQHQP